MQPEFILFVQDQSRSRDFYRAVLGISPSLDVPGMTEFDLGTGCKLGLMPEAGIARIITPELRHPAEGSGIPRAELYLLVESASTYWERAVAMGAKLVSPPSPRNWGHTVGYFSDPDGHVLAIAEPTPP